MGARELPEVSELSVDTRLNDADGCKRIAVRRRACLPGIEVKTVAGARQLPRVFHERFSIVCPIAGVSKRTFRGTCISRVPGDLMLYEPGDFHTNTHFSLDSSFHVVSIDPRSLDPAFSSRGERGLRYFAQAAVTSPKLSAAVWAFVRSMNDAEDELAIASEFAALVEQLGHHRASTRRGECGNARDPGAIAGLRDRLHADLHGEVALDDLALSARLNKYQLLRLFKKYFGASPSAYRQALRVARARTLLRSGRPPSEVAGLLGFADFSHFRRMFIKYAGLSPNEYRRGRTVPSSAPRSALRD